jgi:DNA-binding Xre family transcriptional regulator
MEEGLILFSFIERKRINKTRLAKELGMSKQNLYKIFKSNALQEATKDNFVKALGYSWSEIFQKGKSWLGNSKVDINGLHKAPEVENSSLSDYQQKYIALLEGTVNELREEKKNLQASLSDLKENVLLIRAMQETTQELLAEVLAKQNKKSRQDILGDVGKANGEKYVKLTEEGKFVYAGK